MYAAGKIPGGFFKREGKASERATLERAHGRPPDPAALAEGIPQRGADHRHRALGRLRRRARRARDQRRLGRTDAVAAAVPRPGRSRPGRHHRGRADAQPDAARDGDLHARPDRLRLAGRDHHGRGRRQAGPRGRHPRGARDGPRGDQAHLRRSGRAAAEGRQGEVVRRERQGRPRVALQLAARRGPGQERPGRHLGRRRDDGRGRASQRRRRRRRGRHGAPQPRAHGSGLHRRRAPRRGRQAGRGRAVRRPDPGAVRRGAGLQGAQVRQALGPDRGRAGRHQAALPGRRRRRRARRRHGGRGQEPRSTRSTSRSCAPRSRSTSAGPTGAPRPRSARSPATWA